MRLGRTVDVNTGSDGIQARGRLLDGAAVTQRQMCLAGVSTAVLECGDGPPVVVLHGQGGFAGLWLGVLPSLAATRRVIAPDLPGLGASLTSGGPVGTATVMAWLDELIEQACPEPPVLVGLSMGGQIAARFTAAHPERVAQLVLVSTPGLVGKVRLAPGTLQALIRHQVRPTARSTRRMLHHLTADVERLGERMGRRWEPFLAYMLDRSATPSVRQANRRLMREIGLRRVPPDDLARIAVPTGLVWGRHDRVATLSTAERASDEFGWPLHVIDDAGHLCVAEQPRAFLDALAAVTESGPGPAAHHRPGSRP